MDLTGQVYKFSENKTVTVGEMLGSGATCKSYLATYTERDGIARKCLLKIFMPNGCQYLFENGKCRILSGSIDDFKEKLESYLKKNSKVRAILDNAIITSPELEKYVEYPHYLPYKEEKGKSFEEINLPLNESSDNVRFSYSEEDDDEYYGLMLYTFDGTDFEQNIARYDIGQRIDVLKKFCKIVDIFHRNRFILADIKPSNFMYFSDSIGTQLFKLFDFDSVLEIDDDGYMIEGQDTSSSAFFESPEMEYNMEYQIGVKSDLYSIGAMLLYFVMYEFFKEDNSLKESLREVRKRNTYLNDERLEQLKEVDKRVLSQKARAESKDDSKIESNVTQAFWDEFKAIVNRVMSVNTCDRTKSKDTQFPVEELIDDLNNLYETYIQRGVTAGNIRNHAEKIAAKMDFEFNENLLSQVKEEKSDN